MLINILNNRKDVGLKAAKQGANLIRNAIINNGKATIIMATGTSQFEMLEMLIKEEIDWSVVTCFHLDEYIGLPVSHPASFRNYLKKRFVDVVNPLLFHYINGEVNVKTECDRLHSLIIKNTIDVAFIGIGENGHIAFNDPPADFNTKASYIDVYLDLACRMQQLGEGWFKDLNEVPLKAISMSIHRIMKSEHIICSVPDKRKAKAVKLAVEGEIDPQIPASILQKHPSLYLYLDKESSSLLDKKIEIL